MRFSTIFFLPLALLVTTAIADDKTIIAALDKIAASAAKVNTTVTEFSFGIAGLADIIPLLIDNTALLNDINAGTKVAKASEPLTILQALGVAIATQSLVTGVQTVITTVVNAKPKFDKLLVVSPVILLSLEEQKKATDKFSAAVIAKLPAELVEIGKQLVAPIGAAFDAAIAEYNPF